MNEQQPAGLRTGNDLRDDRRLEIQSAIDCIQTKLNNPKDVPAAELVTLLTERQRLWDSLNSDHPLAVENRNLREALFNYQHPGLSHIDIHNQKLWTITSYVAAIGLGVLIGWGML